MNDTISTAARGAGTPTVADETICLGEAAYDAWACYWTSLAGCRGPLDVATVNAALLADSFGIAELAMGAMLRGAGRERRGWA